MPRAMKITVPSTKTDSLIAAFRPLAGLVTLSVQRGVSLHPPGDLVTAELVNRSMPAAVRVLETQGVGIEPGTSFTTSEPVSIVSPSMTSAITRDSSEATWEEMERMAAKESNMTGNALALMALAGVIAAVGIATNALHIVIGAMAIAPGFQPIARISLGLVAGGRAWRRGAWDTVLGYVTLTAGAAVTAWLLQALGLPALSGGMSYLQPGALVSYWTTTDATAVFIAIGASLAGVLLVASNRSVLTAGVMIALALVPTAALVGMSLATGVADLAVGAAVRWLVDAAILLTLSAAVFAWKRARTHRRGLMH